MNLKQMVIGACALTFGAFGIAHGQTFHYYPPERIHCMLDDSANLSCNAFDRQYLIEDITNAELKKGEGITFHFYSAVAFFTPNKQEASIFLTYHNHDQKIVKLKTTDFSLKPDLKNGTWKQVNEDIYVCDSGYMNCPITNLEQF